MPFVYMLECNDGSFYVGSTVDLEARVSQHNQGTASRYTSRRGRRPVRLVWWEEHERIDEAFVRDKQIQGWGRPKRLALIEHRDADLPRLSRARGQSG